MAFRQLKSRYRIMYKQAKYIYQKQRNRLPAYALGPYYWHNCIFVHIPKTGGVSVARSLFGTLGGGHRTVTDYRDEMGIFFLEQSFKFTFVRHPVSRLFSAYHFLSNGGYDSADAQWFATHLRDYDNFADFVHNWLDEERIWQKNHFYPQYHFVSDPKGRIAVDFIGKFEQLERDYTLVLKQLNLHKPLQHLNRSFMHPTARADKLAPDTLHKIYQIYRTDFHLFGYHI